MDTWLEMRTDRFEKRKKLLFFSSLIYKPTDEPVVQGFRYFQCEMAQILAAFDTGDIAAFEALPFAFDDDGDADTSSVCLLIAYTKSSAFLAFQPQEYQNYVPTLLRDPLLLEGTQASSARDIPSRLDQTY